MSHVNSVVQAFTATVGSGTIVAQQVNFVDELKNKIEEISAGGEEIRATLTGEVGIQTLVKDYFEEFVGFLAQNEAPHDVQDAIVVKTEELIERTQSIDAILVAALEFIREGLEKLDAVSEICVATTDAANELAGMMSESAG